MEHSHLTTRAGITIPSAALTWRFSRSPGPGGQSVNTTDSRVELVVDLLALEGDQFAGERVRTALGDSLRVVGSTERSQLRNREIAIDRALARVDEAAILKRSRRPTRPTRSAVAKRLDTKTMRAQTKAQRRPPSGDE